MLRLAVAALAALLSVIGSAQIALAAGPFGTIHVGLWNGGAFTDDNTGAFSHCAASASYQSGVSLHLGQHAAGNWLIGFSNPAWELTTGETIQIDITLDGQAQFRLYGNAANSKLISSILPDPAVNRIRKSHLMVATGKSQTYQFVLNSIANVLPMISNCVTKVKAGGVASAGDFSTLPTKPAISAAPVKKETVETSPPSSTKTAKLIDVTGTGFVVSASGHIVTNNHVISGCVGDIHGNLVGEGAAILRVVSTDEINDLALLQAPRRFNEMAIIRSTGVRSGDSVIAIGFPFHGLLTSDLTVTTGVVNSLSGLLTIRDTCRLARQCSRATAEAHYWMQVAT